MATELPPLPLGRTLIIVNLKNGDEYRIESPDLAINIVHNVMDKIGTAIVLGDIHGIFTLINTQEISVIEFLPRGQDATPR